MKVALIALGNFRSSAVHLLHALLERDGFDVRSFLFKAAAFRATPQEIELLSNLVREHEPKLIGISFLSTFYKLACTVTQTLRELSDATIIWGGVHPTVRPEDCLKHADIVCVGEGEEAMLELAHTLRSQPTERIHPIRNLWFKTSGELIRNDVRPLLQDLDSLPIPYYLSERKRFIEANRILDLHAHADMVEAYDTMTSRGCPFACDYCINCFLRSLYRDKGRYIRKRSVGHVIDELRLARERYPNLQTISFTDDIFALDQQWLEEFHDRYRREIGLLFFCYVHPNMVRDSTIKMLRDCGLRYVIMGIQSGSARVREQFLGRRTPKERILQSARTLRKYRVRVAYDFIADNPYETDDDRRDTLELIAQFPRPFQLHLFSIGMFPGARLTERALHDGVIRVEDIECMSEKGYDLFAGSLHLARDDNLLKWDVLYFLAKRGIPLRALAALSRSRSFAKHVRLTAKILRCLPIDYYGFVTYLVQNRLNFLVWRLFTYGRILARGDWRFLFKKIGHRILRVEDAHL